MFGWLKKMFKKNPSEGSKSDRIDREFARWVPPPAPSRSAGWSAPSPAMARDLRASSPHDDPLNPVSPLYLFRDQGPVYEPATPHRYEPEIPHRYEPGQASPGVTYGCSSSDSSASYSSCDSSASSDCSSSSSCD